MTCSFWTRTILASCCAIAVAWCSASPLHARYIRPDLVNVPIERLTKNLTELAAKNPKDAKVRLNLARAHAMAYAIKSDTAQAWRGKEHDGVWFGYEPKHVPFDVAPSDDPQKQKAAQKQLQQAIARYEEALKLDPNNLTTALGLAWCVEQSGDKTKAIAAYRQVIESGWKKEKDLKMADLGWHSVTAEAAGYLTALLDREKDAAELRTLNDRVAQMEKVARPITPLVVPLRHGLSLADLEDREARVPFDADGSGHVKHWTWVTNNAGWLVHDPRRSRKITSALQLFGNVSYWLFWDNGYAALAALDDNHDGRLSGPELRDLALWHDRNQNGASDPGEVQPLSAWGIVELSCQHETLDDHPDRPQYSPRGITFRDGSTRATYDLILHPRTTSQR